MKILRILYKIVSLAALVFWSPVIAILALFTRFDVEKLFNYHHDALEWFMLRIEKPDIKVNKYTEYFAIKTSILDAISFFFRHKDRKEAKIYIRHNNNLMTVVYNVDVLINYLGEDFRKNNEFQDTFKVIDKLDHKNKFLELFYLLSDDFRRKTT